MKFTLGSRAEEAAQLEVVYFCAKCGAALGKGQMPQSVLYAVCPACATIITVRQSEPFAQAADLRAVPLAQRGQLEKRAEELRKQLGLPPSIIL